MLDTSIKKRLTKKAKLAWRLNFTITTAVVITMATFEFPNFLTMHKFTGNISGYVEFHLIHTIITITVLMIATRVILSYYVIKPIYKLLIAIEEVKSGKFVTALDIKSNDEFELLAEEFTEMGFWLRDIMQHEVRVGKYSAATALATGITNNLCEPCTALQADAKLLKDIAKGNPQIEIIADILFNDALNIEEKIKEITSITVPEEFNEGL